MSGTTILRILIAGLIFPVLVHLLFTVLTVPLRPVLTPIFETAGARADLLGKGFVVACFVLAVRGAFGLCRRLWPNPTFAELEAAAEKSAKRGPTFAMRSGSSEV